MAVSADILRSWVQPRPVLRRLLAAPQREGRVLSFLMFACLLIFVAQGPRLMREVTEGIPMPDGEPPTLLLKMTYELFGWMIVWPLAFYAIAAVVHAIARLARGRGIGYDTRLAVFWGLLAASPAALLNGLVRGFIGAGDAATLTGALWLSGFVVITIAGVIEAHRHD